MRDERVKANGAAVLTRRDEFGIGPWDVVALLATLFVAVTVPLRLVLDSLDAAWLQAASLLSSLLLAADVVMRFARPITIAGRRIEDPATIRRHYLRGWFTVDVLAAIPFDLLAAGTMPALGLLRVLRVARFLALQREWRVRTSINPAVLRLSFFAFLIAMVSHWVACGWIALDGQGSGHPELHPYQQALYWTITTLTTLGYGDITPVGRNQVAYAMVVMALGAAMYGYIIGNVASLLANVDMMRARHVGRIETINDFMRDRQVPRELQSRVRDYYNYLWESRMGQQTEMLDDLPTPLHVEIALHLNRNLLRKVPLFENASESFLSELVVHLEPTVSIPGEDVVRRGEIGHRIYFINRGSVDVLGPDETTVVATLTDGDFFGEMALLSSRPRANTVRAVDYCNLYALGRDTFDQVLEAFPDFAEDVQRIAEQRRAEAESDR